jgi:branched-chain amino acid transport system substrate-binding protein
LATVAVLIATSGGALAQKIYDVGATDTEIKIGNIMPYSGPASSYGVTGKTEDAYFRKINAEGGINGRKINFISYDDGYSPPKTVEQARKLVESDEVLFIFNSLGTPPNSAIQKYMNTKKVPQLFVATGATRPRLRSTSVSPSIQPVTPAGFTLRARQFVRLMLRIN